MSSNQALQQELVEHDASGGVPAKRVKSYVFNSGTGLWEKLTTSTSQIYKTLLDDYTTTNVTYVGKAAIGSATSSAVWQIQKIDETTGMSITWADSAGFTQVWDNRATTVSYS